ncbi:MAG: UDP-N-acetylglucosamine--N-acetylmuramyl-(pentapeptide) pyrophosphoryl-undecaprenol N-acetylglucosamine transferase [Firmicutes bacterium]|nr:UDP-N-acetylglucosamine--N-acetylmuramyl-(pentapeptide) pyrophosphoryl-undecaprenol N-acetylglucosamine transferase [Bacillota bacterium]
MNLIFTCGGTGGHINPAIAVASAMRARHPDANILFIGAQGHMEEQLVPKAGFPLKCLHVAGLKRGKSPKALAENGKILLETFHAVGECKKILRDFQPDLVMGTGGYACYPALKAGAELGIPTCVHESNAMPGVATKMLEGSMDKVMIAFADSAKAYKHPEKLALVGMPIRSEFLFLHRDECKRALGATDKPLVVSAFGSLGAKRMNETMAELFRLEKEAGFPYRHIHATGKFGWEWMPELVRSKGVDLAAAPDLEMLEYIYNMPTLMTAADVFLSRAGASSCNELGVAGTPCILIPSPNVAEDHQTKNARVLADNGGAVLIPESECSARRLFDEITALLADPARRESMSRRLQQIVVPDATDRICAIAEELIAKHKGGKNGN